MINIIVAVDKNMGIGKDNSLLAHIKSDLEYFKKVTNNNVIVMGYNTYMSLPKRPLPNRINVVITKKDINLEGAVIAHSIEEAMDIAKTYTDKDTFICGGATIYKQFLEYTDKLYVTHIFDNFEADTFFPEIDEQWELECIKADMENIKHKYPHIFALYSKKQN